MRLSAGDNAGPFEVLTPIGAGGIGEVYRAREESNGRHTHHGEARVAVEQWGNPDS